MNSKKLLSLLLISFSLFAPLAADDISQLLQLLQETTKKSTPDRTEEIAAFVQLLQDNAGYYYNYDNESLIYLNCTIRTGDGKNSMRGPVIEEYRYEYNFSKNNLKVGGSGGSLITSDSYRLKEQKARFEVQDGIVVRYRMYGTESYYPLHMTAAEVCAFIRNRAYENMDRTIGTHTDAKTGRTYTISRKDEKYEMTVVYPAEENQPAQTVSLRFSDRDIHTIWGNSYSISVRSDGTGFSVADPVEDPHPAPVTHSDPYGDHCCDDSWGYTAVFPFADQMEKPAVAEPRRTEFITYTYYYTADGKTRINIGNNELSIYTAPSSGWSWDCQEIIYDFESYIDDNGYKKVEYNDGILTIIDGDLQQFGFRDDLTEGRFVAAENLNPTAKSYSYDWVTVTNVRSSSTLKDRYATYSAENPFKTFDLERRLWVQNNIPWVEAKSDDGIGEYIEFDITSEPLNRDVAITLRILGGYVDPLKPYLFRENSRPKTLLVQTDTGFSELLELPDLAQFVDMEIPLESRHVRLTIKDVYPGSKYSDTCISVITPVYKLWDR
ncbi:MAG: hypothetical protein MJ178_08385 [Treponemataceae bacterium]|nr:hypothetical protein [Treponemataceae bacterium]